MSIFFKEKPGILLPPAVGYSPRILIDFFKNNSIHLKYYPRILALGLINLINMPFRAYERLFINPSFENKEIVESPIFILGHWRSGTTYLHNILSKDKQMGYTTTFQSVFPDTLFNKLGRFTFENFAKLAIPGRRKGDNVSLNTSYPQEEEFALGAHTPICFYYFWMFPERIFEYYNSFVRFINVNPKQYESWVSDYRLLIKKALQDTKGNIYLSKNPTNTGRIKVLLKMFPNAKFIHIHRNPIEVFLSTRNFYKKMMPPLQLQDIDKLDFEKIILDIYKLIMSDYADQKDLIPKGNLIEVAFEELESKPEKVLKEIYHSLGLSGYDDASDDFHNYYKTMDNYKKNKHTISKDLLQKVLAECELAMNNYNYKLPENIEIIND